MQEHTLLSNNAVFQPTTGINVYQNTVVNL